MTTTAIIGLGNMGKGLAKRLAGETDLVLAARNTEAARNFARTLSPRVPVLELETAVEQAQIIVLALPFAAALAVARGTMLAGKIVVDMSNPITPDFAALTIGHTTSAAEEMQKSAPDAKIVKAYNTNFAGLFDLPRESTANVPVFLAGNNDDAIAQVEALVAASGFAVEKTGLLDAARLVEPVGMLNIRLGYSLGRGTAIAPTWVAL